MRQTILRLLLLTVIVLIIFGFYRLLTIEPLGATSFRVPEGEAMAVYVDASQAAQAAPYSLEALQAASQAGSDGLFLPLRMTQDGELLVWPLDGANAGQQPDPVPSDLTLAELRSQRGAVLTLREVLAAFPEQRVIAQLATPSDRAVATLLNAVDAEGARNRVAVVIDDQQLADALRQLAPDIITAYTTPELKAFLTTYRLRLVPFYRPAAPVLLLPGDLASQAVVRQAHNRGVAVIIFEAPSTAGSQSEMAALGVDGILVRQP